MAKVEGTGGSREINRQLQLKKGEPAKSGKTLFNYGEEQAEKKTHTVAAKETAFAITRKYNITIYQLAEANNWQVIKNKGNIILKKNGKPVNLTAGMVINIPAPEGQKPDKKEIQKQAEPSANGNYTVASGDSPMKIAEDNEISIRQLAKANNWEIGEDESGKITVLKNGEEIVLQKGEKLNIPQSVTSSLEGIESLSDVKYATGMSDGLATVITRFEGNPDNDYKPYTKAYQDDNGVWTIGFGNTRGVKSDSKMSAQTAYTTLAKDYTQTLEDIRIELGDETFSQIPAPLLEGVVDLVYNKGFEALDTKRFSAAINEGNISDAFKQLIYTKSIKSGKDMNGLYKRSLARLAMVYKEFDSETQELLKPVIDDFYAEAEQRVNSSELNYWYNPNITSELENIQSKYIVQEGDSGLMAIARKLGVNFNELKVLNRHLGEDMTIHPGDVINLPVKGEASTAQKPDKKLDSEILRIKKLDLSKSERLKKTEELFDKYAKYYDIPDAAKEIFKNDAKDEYDSWFLIDTDNMQAMAGVLDAQTPEELYRAIDTAIDESSDARKFAGLVLNKKINKDNIRDLIQNAGGTKKFVKMIRKAGGIDVLRHSLNMMVNTGEDNSAVFKLFEKAAAEEEYSDIINVFNNVLASSPGEISEELAKTLDDDEDLNSMLYKYQIQRIKGHNVLEILRSNDIIAGICEADNDRKSCKAEIMKLFNLIDKNYELDESKKKEFLELVNKEFRERKFWNPTTWWIGTSKISDKFNKLISGNLRAKNVRCEVCKALGLPENIRQLEKLTDENGNVIPLVETYGANGKGYLSGRRIVINAGHGGYGEGNDGIFDPGAINEEIGIDEWMLNRYMAKLLIEKLQEQGAEVILTAGEVNTVSYNDFGGEMKISLHADSHEGTPGPRLYAFNKDKDDKALAQNILNSFINSTNAQNVKDLKRKEITYHLDLKTNDEDIDSIQAKIVDNSKLQILKKDRKNAADEPAILVEYCNIKNNKEVKNIVFGSLGEDIINSIVDGIIDYYNKDYLANR